MRRFLIAVIVTNMLIPSITMAEVDIEAKLATYRTTIKAFAGELKSELMAAMKAGGPIAALEVCNTKAMDITQKASDKAGFTISRTSLKPRRTAPDAWEKQVLDTFEARKAKGDDPATLQYYEVVKLGKQRALRYMKAIPTDAACLTCHGADIAPEIQTKLDELYPGDQATGFKEGDLRGAFSITEILKQ